ncbi:MAG: tautomerase family protein [Pseudomonadota bacterium]
MPLYLCNSPKSTISDEAKPAIAADITRIHCEVTGAPPAFVHVFFLEDSPFLPLEGKSVVLLGNIRAGRTDETKAGMIEQMVQSLHKNAGIPIEDIQGTATDTPARWIMEGGDVFPEPGEEAAWLAAHEAKLSVSGSNI